jgi:ATP-dependent Lhr-like helicase
MLPDPLARFRDPTRLWFASSFEQPTQAQREGWRAIAGGQSTLILAPTGSGKTLAAFLWCLDRVMFDPAPPVDRRCRVVYVSPLKALAVDVDRNMRAPLAGMARIALERGIAHHAPAVVVRTGDTPSVERSRFRRESADILITTPESLYLLLTSGARDVLRGVDTLIVDEIHALVPTKRGAHFALSAERLERLAGRPLQRIGLSATQRPLDEVARFLGGLEVVGAPTEEKRRGAASARGRSPSGRRRTKNTATPDTGAPLEALEPARETAGRPRPVTIVQAGRKKPLELRIEVPVEDMAALAKPVEVPSGNASQVPAPPSIWSAIHPRLLELVRAHRSTLMFVNGRRTAERLAGALNELAGEVLVRAHHGSIAREQRIAIEDQLKAGTLRGLLATSSLELGIDMGAIDLVVQIEAPPSVTSGLQRIGRAGHGVGETSRGILVPKYRGDLVACAAVTRAMHEGRIEASHYPRNPLDVLAQQIVAMVSMDDGHVDEVYDAVRRTAPFADLSRGLFESVLDMLTGRYPSDEFAELRPRLTWDRLSGRLTAREGAKRVAVVNGGTIPDRGLYGVFLAGAEKGKGRVGELDEEMVFESRAGETFVLGASTWRIEEITHDRVLVSPAPGEPGRMPFWKGEGPGRPIEFGREIGALVRQLVRLPAAAAIEKLVRQHDLDERAAENLVGYLASQKAATGVVPDDRTLVVERYRDELGDWRVCLLSPLGGQVLAPWALAAVARTREETGVDVETLWTDDGIVVRFPDTDEPPDTRLVVPDPEEAESLVVRQLGSSALFAAKFRECAARALLLPRRRPGGRAPLWQQRKRAADLLAVASRFGSFPIVLEAYRECLRDTFDMPALADTLRAIAAGELRVATVDSSTPSPFAASLLFGYVANYIYDGDAPLSERRAHALAIDQSQLRELLGDVELRALLDADAIDEVERGLQGLESRSAAGSADAVHDLLLRVGDLSRAELARRVDGAVGRLIDPLVESRRAIAVPVAGATRYIAVEDAARYRDALGAPLPPGLPDALLAPVADPVRDLVRRFARTHGPFTTDECAARFGLGRATVQLALERLHRDGRLVEGEFRPVGSGREWCDAGVLSAIRRRSLAKVRREIEPVPAHVLGRLATTWQGVVRPRAGYDALLDAVESLQGAPLAASVLEAEILPARVADYQPSMLDAVVAAGEVAWIGVGRLGDRDGRVALYLADALPRAWRPGAPEEAEPRAEREAAVLDALARRGALFFAELHEACGGGYQGDTVDALWTLVWQGLVGNDALHALRAYIRPPDRARRVHVGGRAFRSRRTTPPEASGRWSAVTSRRATPAALTDWSAAMAQQLLTRHGLVTRETAQAESIAGGFSAVYDVLRAMDERGKIRRGYFVTGVTATQFAVPAALDLLRSLRETADEPETIVLSATDPANPYGAILRWPERPAAEGTTRGPTRTVGARVVLVDGRLCGYLVRGHRHLLTWLPEDEPDRSRVARALAAALARMAVDAEGQPAGLLVAEIDEGPAAEHELAPYLAASGFIAGAMGFQRARRA